ncbi:hypothetical protein TNCV_2794111 [Trichonephila clavipes]|nr:hypothetical protein TNCV_2794111 [Trichonephila clavipes]
MTQNWTKESRVVKSHDRSTFGWEPCYHSSVLIGMSKPWCTERQESSGDRMTPETAVTINRHSLNEGYGHGNHFIDCPSLLHTTRSIWNDAGPIQPEIPRTGVDACALAGAP